MVKITEEDIDRLDDESRNKIAKYVGAATSSNWPCNEIHLKMLKDIDLSESPKDVNEFRRSEETQSATINKSTKKIGGSVAGNKAMKVSLEMKNGEYVLKLTTGMTDQAQTAAMVSTQAAMLRQLGENLIFLSEFLKSLC